MVIMSRGAFTATAASSLVLAADTSRTLVVLQRYAGHVMYVGIGVVPVAAAGIALTTDNPVITIDEPGLAQQAIHVICAAAETGTGGYQTL